MSEVKVSNRTIKISKPLAAQLMPEIADIKRLPRKKKKALKAKFSRVLRETLLKASKEIIDSNI